MKDVVKERIDPLGNESFRMRQRISRELKGIVLEFTQQLEEIKPHYIEHSLSVRGTKTRNQVNNLLELLDEYDRLTQERGAI